jgi:glucose/arabinose dehydrogenase
VDKLVSRIDFGVGGFEGFSEQFYAEVLADFSVKEEGTYHFRLTSDDGAALEINGQKVADNDGVHPFVPVEGSIRLPAGSHKLVIRYFENTGQEGLRAEWKKEGGEYTVLDGSVLSVPSNLTRVVSPGTKRIFLPGGRQRPGTGLPLDRVHPGWRVETIRPEGWEPKVGALAWRRDGKLLVGTFTPNQSGTLDPSVKDGEVWLLSGVLSGNRSKITRKKFAEGLQEPLGMAVIGDRIFVSTRTAIVELIDKDKDDRVDEQRIVGSGWISDNYHHFTFGLAAKDGWLYGALSTSITFDAPGINGPNPVFRGSAFRIDPDRYDPRKPLANIQFLTSGHRTPNGVSEGPNGLILVGENQGSWQPSNKLNVIQPGGFYGHFNNTSFKNAAYPEGGKAGLFDSNPFTPPGLYLPQGEVANSPGQALAIKKGPFAGQILITDVKYGGLRRGWLEQVDGQWQGGVVASSQGFESGTNRIIEAPDGSLIIGGIGATETWAWTDPATGKWTTFGLQRLVPTGKTAFEIKKISAQEDGFRVEFTEPLDSALARDLTRYAVSQHRYEPTVEYGGPKIDREVLKVETVQILDGGRSVSLTVRGLKNGRIVHLGFDVLSSKKESLWAGEAWYTLNRIPIQGGGVSISGGLMKSVVVWGRTASEAQAASRAVGSVGDSGSVSHGALPSSRRLDPESTHVVVLPNFDERMLSQAGKLALTSYVEAGGGLVIIAPLKLAGGSPWLKHLLGVKDAVDRPKRLIEAAPLARSHPSTSHLPSPWMRVENSPQVTLAEGDVLVGSAEGPLVWQKRHGKGRVWVSLTGADWSWDDPLLAQLVRGGSTWAEGDLLWLRGTRLPLAAWNAQGDWRETDGVMETPTGRDWKLNLLTKEEFGSCLLRLDYKVPPGGNSGVYLMGRYEIQILDSFGVLNKDLKAYMAGAIYERWKDDKGYEGRAPLVNASRPPGEWNTLEISFQAPHFAGDRKIRNAVFREVLLNGVVVQKNEEVTGPTRASWFEDEKPTGPLMLQGDHGPIAYRNVRIIRQ